MNIQRFPLIKSQFQNIKIHTGLEKRTSILKVKKESLGLISKEKG